MKVLAFLPLLITLISAQNYYNDWEKWMTIVPNYSFTLPSCPPNWTPHLFYCWLCVQYVPGCMQCPAVQLPFQKCGKCDVRYGYDETAVPVESQTFPGEYTDYCLCKGRTAQNVNDDPNYYNGMGGCLPCRTWITGCADESDCVGYLDYPSELGGDLYCQYCDVNRGFIKGPKWTCHCASPNTFAKKYDDYDNCDFCNVAIPGCLTCQNETFCNTCDSNLNFNPVPNASNLCECVPPFTLNQNGGCSQSCPAGCLTCPNPLICSACDQANNFQLNLNTNQCVCSPGFILDGFTCKPCSNFISGCSLCSSQTNCTSCSTSQHFVLNITSGKCNCADTFFASVTGTPNPTSFTCLTCLGYQTQCVACISPQICTRCTAKYAVSANDDCLPCDTVVTGCDECSDLGICTKCRTADHFVLSGEQCVCANSYYYNNTVNYCLQCQVGCLTCKNSTTCQTCANTHALNSALSCELCSVFIIGCTRCLGSNECTQCDTANGFSLNNQRCTCSFNQYLDTTAKACKRCDQTPLQNCSNCQSETFCLSCSSSKYTLHTISSTEQVCRSCSVTLPGCIECSSNSTCTLCDQSQNFQVDSNGKCGCIDGYFLGDNGVCALCSDVLAGCLECSSAVACTYCDPFRNYALDTTTSTCGCRQNYFLNSSNQCQRITTIPGCLNYIDNTTCGGCGPNFRYYKNKCQCLDGYYLQRSNNTCQRCTDSRCAVCSQKNQCWSCPIYHYIDANGGCPRCGDYCQRCNATTCLACYGTALKDPNNQSSCYCRGGMFPSLNKIQCVRCDRDMVHCIACDNNTVCLACQYPANLYNGRCDVCPRHFYLSPITNQCQVCAVGCINCHTVPDNCTQCLWSATLYWIQDLVNGDHAKCLCKPPLYLLQVHEPPVETFWCFWRTTFCPAVLKTRRPLEPGYTC